jgi:hypothetical protein
LTKIVKHGEYVIDYSYDEFEKMEKGSEDRWGAPNAKPKHGAKDFVLKLLQERPYTLKEIETHSSHAQLAFVSGNPNVDTVTEALGKLIEDKDVEMRYDEVGRIFYGLPKKVRNPIDTN